MTSKQEELKNHIISINKRNNIAMIVLLLIAALVQFTNFIDKVGMNIYHVIFVMILVHLIDINLKQRAMIRYMTDSISDND